MTKKKKMRFYLAHPLGARLYVRRRELELEKEHKDLKLLNPFYDVNREDIKKIDKGISTRWNFTKADCKRIVESDLKTILSADGILAIIDGNQSYGTLMEIMFAKSSNKLVILLVTNGAERHPWLRYYADIIVKNWDRVYEAIKKVYDKQNG